MAYYLVVWKGKGTRHTERIRANSEEEAKSKSFNLHRKHADFMIVSVELVAKNRPIHLSHGGLHLAPTLKQFSCSFSILINGTYEMHQIALYALDETSAKEMLHRTYSGIIMHTIRVVEVI